MSTGRNTRHLPSIPFDRERIIVSCDLATTVAASDTLVVAVPSVYVADVLRQLPQDAYAGKRIVSAVKGYVPQEGLSISQFVNREFHVSDNNFCVISGPSHAEEVAEGLPTFLSVASHNSILAYEVAKMIHCRYIHTSVSDEVHTLEFNGLAKNIYAVAAGVAVGIGYGDNTVSMLIAAAARELHNLLPDSQLHYHLLGDLMVTCFSRHSRNRALGEAVAGGESISEYFRRTGMVAEGYYSAAAMHNMPLPCPIPIAEAVYRILHEGASPRQEVEHLIDTAV